MTEKERNFWGQVTACVPLSTHERRGAALRAALRRLPLGAVFWGAPSLGGRAAQLNAMSLQARTPLLWHLHADSTLDPGAAKALSVSATRHPGDLHYFRLRFAADGPSLSSLNARAANWRARALGLPFGDQGFLVPRAAFLGAGAYDESLARGEDLDFVVRAASAGLTLREVPAFIESSSRRYAQEGWMATTLKHLGITLALALRAKWKSLGSADLKPALAAFVKTPGRSPLKTRLAAGLGRPKALALYKASLNLVRELLIQAGRSGLCHPVWAVAEKTAVSAPLWRGLDRRWAGPGPLQERLSETYDSLLKLHGSAVFIGSDAPQLSMKNLLGVLQALRRHDFVLIPALDGGYVLFAGRRPLPRRLWLDVPLSQGDTCKRFASALKKRGSLKLFEPMADFDTAADLPHVIAELGKIPEETMSPRELALAASFRRAAASPSP